MPRLKFRQKNRKPEVRFIQLELLPYLRQIGCDVEIIESKAVWSPSAKRYLKGMSEPGHSDIAGNLPNGMAIYVEAKSPLSKITPSKLRDDQWVFLMRKINTNAFAVVVNNVEDLHEMLCHWTGLVEENKLAQAREYLVSKLPKKRGLIIPFFQRPQIDVSLFDRGAKLSDVLSEIE